MFFFLSSLYIGVDNLSHTLALLHSSVLSEQFYSISFDNFVLDTLTDFNI